MAIGIIGAGFIGRAAPFDAASLTTAPAAALAAARPGAEAPHGSWRG